MLPGIRGLAAILGVALLVAGCSSSAEPPAQSAERSPAPSTAVEPAAATPLLVEVLSPPIPVPATDGKVHLAYELQLTNALGQDVTVSSVAVKAGDKTLLTLAGDRLPYWMRTLGGTEPTSKLGPGQSAVVWLDVVIDGPTDSTPAVPQELSHTIVTNLTKPMPPLLPATMTEDVAPVTVSTHEPPVISPPLDGTRWVDGNGCCDMTPHRMALNPLNGKLWAAERFAIDYVEMSPDGTIYRGDASKPESYRTSAPTSTPSPTAPWSVSSTDCPNRWQDSLRPGCPSTSTEATTSFRTSETATTRSTLTSRQEASR